MDASLPTHEPGVQLRRYIKFLTSGSRGWGGYYADHGDRFLRIGNLSRGNLEIGGEIQFVNLPFDVTEGSRTILEEGDLLFSITAYLGSVAVVAGDWVGAYVSQHVALCRLEPDRVDPRFIGWFMLTTTGQDQLNEGAAGGTKMQLALDDIRGLRIPTAPIEEQRRIAAYLDRETARIDTLIEEQQALVRMLRERRVATIAAALDGYEMTHLRRLVDRERPMTYGILQCGEPVDGGVAYIGPSDITGEGVSPERDALRTTTTEIASAYRRSVLAGGDVVVSIGPAYGKVTVVSDDLTGANLTQDTVRVALLPDLVDTRFVVWALLSRQVSEYWDYQVMGATFRRLNLGTLARTPIPLPSIDVQRTIAASLNEQTAKIDLLIAETEQFIELSKERRSALITAAVTGQIDVREMV